MNFKIVHPYDEMEDNGLMIADVYIGNKFVAQIEHTDLMGGHDEIRDILQDNLQEFLMDLHTNIDNGYGCVESNVDGTEITFTDDEEVFAIIKDNKLVFIEESTLASAMVAISSYFW